MKRITHNITESQSLRLKALAKVTGFTVSELVRRFLEEGLDREERKQKEKRKP